MKVIFCITLLLYSFSTSAQTDEKLQNRLIKMAEQSLQVRQSVSQYTEQSAPAALQSIATDIDNLHTKTLQEMVALHGWPNQKLVGKQAVQATFLLVQHARDLSFQLNMLPLVIQSYLDGEGVAGQNVAELTDTVAIKQGKKQVFGTQAEIIDGQIVLAPIEDENSVEQLRAQLGLGTLAEYKKTLETLHGLD
jgi:hypothetical protein